MERESSAVETTDKTSEHATSWVQSAIETVVQTSFGQTSLKLVDKFLWIVEKSAEWSLPYQESTDDNGKTFLKLELVRPLPWILFLPGLVILRTIRVGTNIGAFILGYPQVQPNDVVTFVQKSRRSLKTIKTNGLRNLRRKMGSKDKRLSMNEAKKALIRSIRLTLSTLSCLDGSKPSLSPPPTRIHVSALDLDTITSPEEKSTTESTDSPKRKYSMILSDDSHDESPDESEPENLNTKIDRLALESSTDDTDFNPTDCSILSTASDKDEADLNVSINELRDITDEAKSLNNEASKSTLNVESKEEQAPEQRTPSKESCDTAERVTSPQSIDSREISSPSNPSQDGDADFYSPISSKSETPERSMSPGNEKSSDTVKTNEFGNGEIYYSSGSTISGQSSEDTNSGVIMEKRNTNVNKSHHKGKRASHVNRKRK